MLGSRGGEATPDIAMKLFYNNDSSKMATCCREATILFPLRDIEVNMAA